MKPLSHKEMCKECNSLDKNPKKSIKKWKKKARQLAKKLIRKESSGR